MAPDIHPTQNAFVIREWPEQMMHSDGARAPLFAEVQSAPQIPGPRSINPPGLLLEFAWRPARRVMNDIPAVMVQIDSHRAHIREDEQERVSRRQKVVRY